MIEKRAWYINMPTKVKEILDSLIKKAETKSCIEAEKVVVLRNRVNWNSIPMVVDEALELLKVDTHRTDRSLLSWNTLPEKIELLNTKVENLDCRSLSTTTTEVSPQKTSSITLVEFDENDDLSGENQEVSMAVYFEDKSGDEIPNVGKKLFLDKELVTPLTGYKGAFYFIRPSHPSEKVTISTRGTGTVKKTKFDVDNES